MTMDVLHVHPLHWSSQAHASAGARCRCGALAVMGVGAGLQSAWNSWVRQLHDADAMCTPCPSCPGCTCRCTPGAGFGLASVEEYVQQALDLHGGINRRMTCGLDIRAFLSGLGQSPCWLVTGLNTCLTRVHPSWNVVCSACCCTVCTAGEHMLLSVFSEACSDVCCESANDFGGCPAVPLAHWYQASVACQQLAAWGLSLAAWWHLAVSSAGTCTRPRGGAQQVAGLERPGREVGALGGMAAPGSMACHGQAV